jgi:hypothetical protein
VSDEERQKDSTTRQITFNYVKSNFHRVIHTDETFSGVTPNGEIYVELCSERPSLPRQIVVSLDKSGQVKEEAFEPQDVNSHIDREMEASIVMNLETAESLFLQLFDLLESLKEDDNNVKN